MTGLVLRGAVTALALTALACIGLDGATALAQSTDKTTEIEINGIQLRIPREYVDFDHWRRIVPDSFSVENGEWKGEFVTFRFWLSDGRPPLTKLEYSLAEPWPPDPGRPSQGAEDFVVHVFGARFLTAERAARTQPFDRNGRWDHGFDTHEVPSIHGMSCRRDRAGRYMSCLSASDAEPSIWLWASHLNLPRARFNAQVFSRADSNLEFTASIPSEGIDRVPEVVCRVLWFVRTWRISDGPALPNCPKPPRFALK